eukprot:8171220-Pyramimonas_sp.AAC.2
MFNNKHAPAVLCAMSAQTARVGGAHRARTHDTRLHHHAHRNPPGAPRPATRTTTSRTTTACLAPAGGTHPAAPSVTTLAAAGHLLWRPRNAAINNQSTTNQQQAHEGCSRPTSERGPLRRRAHRNTKTKSTHEQLPSPPCTHGGRGPRIAPPLAARDWPNWR